MAVLHQVSTAYLCFHHHLNDGNHISTQFTLAGLMCVFAHLGRYKGLVILTCLKNTQETFRAILEARTYCLWKSNLCQWLEHLTRRVRVSHHKDIFPLPDGEVQYRL